MDPKTLPSFLRNRDHAAFQLSLSVFLVFFFFFVFSFWQLLIDRHTRQCVLDAMSVHRSKPGRSGVPVDDMRSQ